MSKSRKSKIHMDLIGVSNEEIPCIDDPENADWPKRTDDSWAGCVARDQAAAIRPLSFEDPLPAHTTELRGLPAAEKLKLYAAVSAEMVRCGLTRTQNNPVGDVAETLFCRALGLNKKGNSSSHVDAIGCNDGLRYQIKGRRLVGNNGSRQMSALRDLDRDHFDFLGAVLFNEDFTVHRAAVIPVDVVRKLSKPDKHTRSSRFMLTDDIWDDPQVWDVTDKLRAVDLDAPLTEQALKAAASYWYGERHC